MNKALLSFGVAGVIAYSIPVTNVQALERYDNNIVSASFSDEVKPLAEGLILRYRLGVSETNGAFMMDGEIFCASTMKSIEYRNIKVQYSDDNKNWYTEKTIDDLTKTSVSKYQINNYSISVKGNHYYRITCTHYAKEKGLLGDSQSISNTSNSVWINS